MPKLPVVSSDEVIKALSKFGFTVSSQRGSHVKLRKGSLSLIVPRHNELGKGIPRKIIKQGVSLQTNSWKPFDFSPKVLIQWN